MTHISKAYKLPVLGRIRAKATKSNCHIRHQAVPDVNWNIEKHGIGLRATLPRVADIDLLNPRRLRLCEPGGEFFSDSRRGMA